VIFHIIKPTAHTHTHMSKPNKEQIVPFVLNLEWCTESKVCQKIGQLDPIHIRGQDRRGERKITAT